MAAKRNCKQTWPALKLFLKQSMDEIYNPIQVQFVKNTIEQYDFGSCDDHIS